MKDLAKLLLVKWIESKSVDDRKKESLDEMKNGKDFRCVLGKSSSGNDILSVEFYSSKNNQRIEYSINLNELGFNADNNQLKSQKRGMNPYTPHLLKNGKEIKKVFVMYIDGDEKLCDGCDEVKPRVASIMGICDDVWGLCENCVASILSTWKEKDDERSE
jgi:hypothetical protein